MVRAGEYIGLALVGVVVVAWCGCAVGPDSPGAPSREAVAGRAADFPGLHNVVEYAPGLIAGASPAGDAGFDTLAAMGVRTVISVDGAVPDLPRARARGMRYVHLPIGYDAVGRERTLAIARAVQLARTRGEPAVYLHCHHGKHRGAAALGAAAVALGELSADDAVAKMGASGASPAYAGLFVSVERTAVASAEELAAAGDEFPQVWVTTGLVRAMVEIDARMDHLRAVQAAGWRVPADHPDLVPAAEAGALADLLRNLAADEEALAKPAGFREMLASSAAHARELEEALAHERAVNHAQLTRQLRELSASCTACHRVFRD